MSKTAESGRLPVSKITVNRPTEENKRVFLRITGYLARGYGLESFENISNADGADTILAYASHEGVEIRGRGTTIRDPIIHVCRDDFRIRGIDHPHSKDFVIRHEQEELWNITRGMYAPEDTPEAEDYDEASHEDALREEFRLAAERGKLKEHLDFIRKAAKHLLDKEEGDYFVKESEQAARQV